MLLAEGEVWGLLSGMRREAMKKKKKLNTATVKGQSVIVSGVKNKRKKGNKKGQNTDRDKGAHTKGSFSEAKTSTPYTPFECITTGHIVEVFHS